MSTTTEPEEKAYPELIERINQLEAINKDLVQQRQEHQSKNDRLTSEQADEKLQLEVQSYKDQLKEQSEKYETLNTEYLTSKNKQIITGLLGDVETQNQTAKDQVIDHIMKNATFGDEITFQNEDGTTRFNEDQLWSVKDEVQYLKESEMSYLFTPTTGAGTQATVEAKPSINSIIDAGLSY